MPKIIPDLGPRILEMAARHFEIKGFDATDMKTLARELGISVGTLYNYYPSKPELFLEVSLVWKDQLSRRMLARLDEPEDAAPKLRAVLEMLYDDMMTFRGMWQEFLRSGATFAPDTPLGRRFRHDNEPLNHRLQGLFREVWNGHPQAQDLVDEPGDAFTKLVVGSIMQMVMGARDQSPDQQRAFTQKWIRFLVPN